MATAAFRKASNGAAFLLQLRDEGLPLRLISQDREAFLGFLTANHHCPDVAAYDLVSWDCGGGSFQITAEVPPAWESWMKSMGTSVAKTLLLTKVWRHLYRLVRFCAALCSLGYPDACSCGLAWCAGARKGCG